MDQALNIAVVLNGVAQSIPRSTIADLLAARGLAGKKVAVERNGAIVPRSAHASTSIDDGDRLEVVVAVGGG